jgi:hypothetical protein
MSLIHHLFASGNDFPKTKQIKLKKCPKVPQDQNVY